MTELTLTKTRLLAGEWEGLLSGVQGDVAPNLTVTYLQKPLDGLRVEKVDDKWFVRIPIPTELVSDGFHVFVVSDENGEKLADCTIMAGEPIADDLRAEVELLREELDMLKRAFRRHCLEVSEIG